VEKYNNDDDNKKKDDDDDRQQMLKLINTAIHLTQKWFIVQIKRGWH